MRLFAFALLASLAAIADGRALLQQESCTRACVCTSQRDPNQCQFFASLAAKTMPMSGGYDPNNQWTNGCNWLDTNGPWASWMNNNSADYCQFPGITCDTSGNVVALAWNPYGAPLDGSWPSPSPYGAYPANSYQGNLGYVYYGLNYQLKCSIPPNVGNLNKLTFLDFSFQKFAGPIPTSIGSLQQLTYLSLTGNSFVGYIPTNIFPIFPTSAGLQNLLYLDLSGLGGPISGPSTVMSMYTMTNLLAFKLGTNTNLASTVTTTPGILSMPSLSGLTSLKFFSFEDGPRAYGGTVSTALWSLKTLTYLDLSNHNLAGTVPQTMVNWPLSTLYLTNAPNLVGCMPSDCGSYAPQSNVTLTCQPAQLPSCISAGGTFAYPPGPPPPRPPPSPLPPSPPLPPMPPTVNFAAALNSYLCHGQYDSNSGLWPTTSSRMVYFNGPLWVNFCTGYVFSGWAGGLPGNNISDGPATSLGVFVVGQLQGPALVTYPASPSVVATSYQYMIVPPPSDVPFPSSWLQQNANGPYCYPAYSGVPVPLSRSYGTVTVAFNYPGNAYVQGSTSTCMYKFLFPFPIPPYPPVFSAPLVQAPTSKNFADYVQTSCAIIRSVATYPALAGATSTSTQYFSLLQLSVNFTTGLITAIFPSNDGGPSGAMITGLTYNKTQVLGRIGPSIPSGPPSQTSQNLGLYSMNTCDSNNVFQSNVQSVYPNRNAFGLLAFSLLPLNDASSCGIMECEPGSISCMQQNGVWVQCNGGTFILACGASPNAKSASVDFSVTGGGFTVRYNTPEACPSSQYLTGNSNPSYAG
jgi:hypothetical protein